MTRSAGQGEPAVRGFCRCSSDIIAGLGPTYYLDRLDTYRVASGEKPDSLQLMTYEDGGLVFEMPYGMTTIALAKRFGNFRPRRTVRLKAGARYALRERA